MKDHYEVTIGIPVYQSVEFISETLCSALNQTFQDLELLIVDDCGNDGSMDVVYHIQNTHPRGKDICVLSNGKNLGVSYCRNLIINKAKGRYLYFMDSDDLIEANTIQLLYEAITHNDVQIAYGSYDIIDKINHSPTQTYQKDSMILKGNDKLAMFAFKNMNVFHVSVCNILIDLSFLRQIGLRFIDVNYWEDMAFSTELVSFVTRAVLLSVVTYHYIRRPGSLSHYQERIGLMKCEIQRNVFVIDYLKRKCLSMRGKSYLPYLGYNLEMNSFYIVCHILKSWRIISPKFTYHELRDIMWNPIQIKDVVSSRHKFLPNIFFYLISKLPICFFIPSIVLVGKLKGCFKNNNYESAILSISRFL